MLKVILVDDEYMSIERFKSILKEMNEIELIGEWDDPEEALEFLSNTEETIDIAFLDIEMPKITGLQLAEYITAKKMEINVVFLTAYEKYALDAFKVHATSYLLKPIDIKDLKKQVEYIVKKKNIKNKERKNIYISTFGGFECKFNDNQIMNFRTKKAEELLAFLIQNQSKIILKETIIEFFWPDMDIKKALNNLYTNIYYLKKKLEENGFEEFLLKDRKGYYLKIEDSQVDFIIFNKKYEQINDNSTLEELLEVSKLYKGEYLKNEQYIWAYPYATYFENAYTKLQLKIMNKQIKENNLTEAIQSIENLIYYNPYSEVGYKKLIELLSELNEKIKIKKNHECYLQMMQELSLCPSENMEKLVKKALER